MSEEFNAFFIFLRSRICCRMVLTSKAVRANRGPPPDEILLADYSERSDCSGRSDDD